MLAIIEPLRQENRSPVQRQDLTWYERPWQSTSVGEFIIAIIFWFIRARPASRSTLCTFVWLSVPVYSYLARAGDRAGRDRRRGRDHRAASGRRRSGPWRRLL